MQTPETTELNPKNVQQTPTDNTSMNNEAPASRNLWCSQFVAFLSDVKCRGRSTKARRSQDADPMDTGRYRCLAVNPYGMARKEFRVLIMVSFVSVKFCKR